MTFLSARGLVIGATLLFFVSSFFLASRLHLDESIATVLPDDDPAVQEYYTVLNHFRTLDKVFIDIGSESADPEDIIAVADALHDRLVSSGMFADVHYRTTNEKMGAVMSALGESESCLLSAQDLEAFARHLTPDAIDARLAAAWRNLVGPSGSFMQRQVRQDPFGVAELILAKFEQLRETGGGAQIVDGRIWSAGRTHLLMIAAPGFPAMDISRGAPLVAFLYQAREETLRAAGKRDVRISYTGGHIGVLDNTKAIKEDVNRTVTASSIAIGILGVLFFKRKLYVALIFLPVSFGLACAAAFFGLVHPAISGIAIGCGSALIGVTVDYGIYVLYRLDNTAPEDFSIRACITSMASPLFLCALTTIAAFVCLMFSSLPGQRQMGAFCMLGVLGAVTFSTVLLPYFVPRPKGQRGGRTVFTSALLGFFVAWKKRHGRLLIAGSIAVFGVSVCGLPKLEIGTDMSRMVYLTPQDRQDESLFLRVWGSFSPTCIVCRGANVEEALEQNDRLLDILSGLQQAGLVSEVSSIASLLPSVKTQTENAQRWRAFWSPEQRQEAMIDLERAGTALHFAPGTFDPFFDLVALSPKPITPRHFEGTGIEDLLESFIATRPGETMVMTRVRLAEGHYLDELDRRVRAAMPNTIIVDRRHFAQDLSALIARGFVKISLWAGAAVLLCLWVMLRRVELVLACFLPVCLSVLFTLGTLGLTGIPINMVNTLFVIFVLGVGVDYAIYLLNSSLDIYRGRDDFNAATVGTVTMCALTTMCGFGALLIARHPVLLSIGITGVLGIMSSLVAALLITPGIAKCLWPYEGRYGTPSAKTLMGAVYVYGGMVFFFLLYLLLVRHLLRLWHWKDVEARQRFLRTYVRKVALGIVRSFPYPTSQRIYVDAGPDAFAKPGVIVSNHQSGSDILLVLALPVEMVMMVKDWVWNAPLMGRVVQDAGYLHVNRMDTGSLMRRCADLLKRGVSISVFPEGARSPDGKMRRFHMGAFELAVQAKADIIPVLLTNTWDCIPWHAFWIGDHSLVVRALPRVTPDTFDYSQGARVLAAHVKAKMKAHQDADWRHSQAGPAFWANLRSLYHYRGVVVEREVAWRLRRDPLCKRIDGLVPETGVVLDVGCGYGLLSNLLAGKSPHRTVIGIDSDSARIRVAQRSVQVRSTASFAVLDASRDSLPEADTVLLVDAVGRWPAAQRRDVVARVCASVRPGGVVLFREDGFKSPALRMMEAVGLASVSDSLPEEDYVSMFEECGLTVEKEYAGLGPGSTKVLLFGKSAT